MAVYTRIEPEEIERLVWQFAPDARLVRWQEVAAGIENSNYFVDLEAGDRTLNRVLTVFEMGDTESLGPVLAYQRHLAKAGLPVPEPALTTEGAAWAVYDDKPVVLVPRVPGSDHECPSGHECYEVGAMLAEIHLASLDYPGKRLTVRDMHWLEDRGQQVSGHLSETVRELLNAEMARQKALLSDWSRLPGGWGHMDLFRDNILFTQGTIGGVIDFYQSCEDAWLLDIAISLNDWAGKKEGGYDHGLGSAWLAGYESRRPLLGVEWQFMVDALALAALRFWLSRLLTWFGDGYQKRARHGTAMKDPRDFENQIRWLRGGNSIANWQGRHI